LRRLREHADKINLDLSEISFSSVENSLFDLIAANKIERGRARISLFDCRASSVWKFETGRTIDFLITTADMRPVSKAFDLTVSPYRVNAASPLAGIKSLNYLENLLAFEDAQRRGFNEAVRSNERGEIVSACLANIFWTKGESVFTPLLKTGALEGTTRSFVLDLADKINLQIFEVAARIEDLQSADEVFLTSAGLEICAAQSLDGKVFSRSAITQKLQNAFREGLNSFIAANEP
jgi:branched-subunit amino acid aminotransferase/4-amino-4-deoxychorismate lyase